MALSFYKKSAAMVISYGKKTKSSQQGKYIVTTFNLQFAPVLKENPTGMGYLYDWKNKKVYFQLALNEILLLAEKIEIANKTKNWDACKIFHKYGDTTKLLNISPYKTIYTIHVQTGDIKLTIGLSIEEMKMFIDYIKFAALSELIKDGEYYFQHINEKVNNENINSDIDNNNEEDSEDIDLSDIDF